MAAKLMLVLLSLILTVAIVNGQTCFPNSNITNLWDFGLTIGDSPVTVSSKICGDNTMSCCDDATLQNLQLFWNRWRGDLATDIITARAALKDVNIIKQFEQQSNISLNLLPEYIRKPFQNALNFLQKYYQNYANIVQSCYEGALQYYAGALCTFCSPNWSNTLNIEEVFPNYYAVNWNVSNTTCSYIANKCSGISDSTFELFAIFSDVAKALNETSFFEDDCPRGYTDTSAVDDSVVRCAPDCRYIVGFASPDIVPSSLNFSELLDAGVFGREEGPVVTPPTTRGKVKALFAFLDDKVQEIRGAMPTRSPFAKRQTQVSGQFEFPSSTVSTGSNRWYEVNHYGQGGADLSSQSTSLSTQGSGGGSSSSSAMTSLPYVAILAFVVALFMF